MPRLTTTIAPLLWVAGFLAFPVWLLVRFTLDPGMFPTLFSGGMCMTLIVFATGEEWFLYHLHMLVYHLLVYFSGTALVMACIVALWRARRPRPSGQASRPTSLSVLSGALGVILLVVGYWAIYGENGGCALTLISFFQWGGGVGLWLPFATVLVVWMVIFWRGLMFIRRLPR